MYCLRCGSTGIKSVYLCLDCYEDNIEDSLMCKDCKKEHIEANYGNKTRFKKYSNWNNLPKDL